MKTNLIILCCFIGTGILAQSNIQKGTVMLGASSNLLGNFTQLGFNGPSNNIGITFNKSKGEGSGDGFAFDVESSETTVNISPTLGYFISNRFMVSLPFGIYYAKEDDFSLTFFSLTPAVRGYLKTTGKTLPYLEVKGGYSWYKSSENDKARYYNMFGGKAGANTFLSSKVALNYFIDYIYAFQPEQTVDRVTSKGFNSIFGFGIGLDIFL